MLSRGFAVASILAVASVAQAGATVSFVFDPPVCSGERLLVNTEYTVHVELLQDLAGSDQRLRMIELDLAQSSPFLVITLPTTHNLDTIGTSDDIHFWSFASVPACLTTPSFCGFNHHIDDDMPVGAVDTRPNVLSAAFYGLTVDATAQVNLTGGSRPTPLRIGTFLMTPTIVGSATLNVMNAAEVDPNRRARIDFGFDPHITWRTGNPAATGLAGGVRPFEIIAGPCNGPLPPVLSPSAQSVPPYTGVGIAPPPAGGSLWRTQRTVARLTFAGTLSAAPTAGQIQINQLLPAGAFGLDVSANGFTFTLENGPNGTNSVLRVADDLTSDFPHRTWFAIRNTGGWAAAQNFEAQYPVQVGDAGANNNVLAADVLTINSRVSCLVNCGGDQIREDINGDQRILAADVLEANSRVSSLPVTKPTGH